MSLAAAPRPPPRVVQLGTGPRDKAVEEAMDTLVAETVVDGPPVVATTEDGDEIAAAQVSSLGGTELAVTAPGGGKAAVEFPAFLGGAATVAVVAYAASPRPQPRSGSQQRQEGGGLASGVVEISVNFTVSGLAEPILITLPGSQAAETCKWWDEETQNWSEEGCTWLDGVCACDHLTLFAACLASLSRHAWRH